MNAVAFAGALVLAGVLVYAGIAKFAAHDATRAAFAGLGLPAPAALAWVVPGVEVATALALVARPRLGAAAALVLLGAFTVLLVVRLARDEPGECACFGTGVGARVSWGTVGRNLVLAAIAAAVLVYG